MLQGLTVLRVWMCATLGVLVTLSCYCKEANRSLQVLIKLCQSHVVFAVFCLFWAVSSFSHCGTFNFVSSRWKNLILCAWKSPYTLHTISEVSLTLPLKQFQCLTMSGLFRPVKEDRLSVPLSSKQSVVWWPWLCARR